MVDMPVEGAVLDSVSQDGSELLVTTAGGPGLDRSHWSVPIPAGSPRQLTDISGHDGIFAANGKLYFGKGNDVYVADHGGSNARKLFSAVSIAQYLALSPDMTRLRFTVFDAIN